MSRWLAGLRQQGLDLGCIWSILSVLMEDALSRGLIVESPLKRISKTERPRRKPKSQRPCLTDAECSKLIAHSLPSTRRSNALRAYTGPRQAEALGLTWNDVDFEAGELHVRFPARSATTASVPSLRPGRASGSPDRQTCPAPARKRLEAPETGPLSCPEPRYDATCADVAQLVEHFTRNEGVRGSSPRVGLAETSGLPAISAPLRIHASSRASSWRPLPKIDVPVLVVHGTEDRILPCASTPARLPELIDDVELVPVEGGSHNIAWTHPEEVNRALLGFVGAAMPVAA